MITSITEYKYTLAQTQFKAFATLEKLLLLTENNDTRTFEWDLSKDITDDLSIIDKLKLTKDKVVEYFNMLLMKLHRLPSKVKVKLFKIVIVSFVSLLTLPQIITSINSQFSKEPDTITELVQVAKVEYNNVINKINNKKTQEYKTPTMYSDSLVEFLKFEEGSQSEKGEPVLTAYNIGDGKITIGYGHAEPINNTKMIAGKTVISKKQAIDLLKKDINEAKRGLDRILSDWKKTGIKVKITQGMYDSMISMIYNMGIGNFRKTEFIQLVKSGKYEEAKDKIKHTNVSYPGHVIRREKEAKLFASSPLLIDNQEA